MERSRDEPQSVQQQEQPAKKRFQIHKLEDRIAPRNCHYNYKAGKWVGCGKGGYYCYCW